MKTVQVGFIFAFLFVLLISNSIQIVSSAALLKKSAKTTACKKQNEECVFGKGQCCFPFSCGHSAKKCIK